MQHKRETLLVARPSTAEVRTLAGLRCDILDLRREEILAHGIISNLPKAGISTTVRIEQGKKNKHHLRRPISESEACCAALSASLVACNSSSIPFPMTSRLSTLFCKPFASSLAPSSSPPTFLFWGAVQGKVHVSSSRNGGCRIKELTFREGREWNVTPLVIL